MKRSNGRFILFVASLALLVARGALLAETIDPQKAKPDADGKTLWYDCQNLCIEGKGWTETESFYDRLPAKAKGVVPPSVWGLSQDSAGICVRFSTDAPAIQVRWTVRKGSLAMPHMPATGVSGVDLYTKDKSGRWLFTGNGRPAAESNTTTFGSVPGQPNMLVLPLYNGVKSIEIGIPKENTLSTPDAAEMKAKKPIVFYGTSITQGGCVSRPGMACAAIVGRQLDMPTINLGFSGSGKMEPALADLLVELDPSVYVLDCLWNMSSDMVKERIEPFVKQLRAAHPDTPILLAEDSNFRNAATGKGNIVREVVAKLQGQGVKGLYFLSNENMIGDDWEGTVDGCHPNDLGMMRQAEAFVKALRPIVKP